MFTIGKKKSDRNLGADKSPIDPINLTLWADPKWQQNRDRSEGSHAPSPSMHVRRPSKTPSILSINFAGFGFTSPWSPGKKGPGDFDMPGPKRTDFLKTLPWELTCQILALLDLHSLIRASLVCRDWLNLIDSPDIWREIFYRERAISSATAAPIMPGFGLGAPPVEPGVDWKAIYKTRLELEKRWKKGRAKPIFLEGHRDSVYCLQFDQYVQKLGQFYSTF